MERASKEPTAVQISFAPFLLPGVIERDQLENVAVRVAKEIGCRNERQNLIERAVIGPDHVKLCTEIGSASVHVYLLAIGVGIVRVDWPPEKLSRDPRSLLEIRRKRHKEIIEGTSIVGARVHSIANQSSESNCFLNSFPILTREESSPFDYVFSMFELSSETSLPNDVLNINEAALLEPSHLGVTDTTWEPDRPLLPLKPSVVEPSTTNFPDLEMSGSIQCRMSWASVVISGVVPSGNRDLYSALEVRTQGLWILAYRIGQIRYGLAEPNLLQVETLSALFEQAVRALLRLNDPSANDRILKLHEGIERSSKVDQKVRDARENIDTLRGIVNARETNRRSQFESVAQMLLFFISALQLLPIVFPTPFSGRPRVILITLWALFLLTFIVVRIRSKWS